MKNILVVGGAGYIGSYMCKYLAASGFQPIVLDDLSYGHPQAVCWGPFHHGCMSDTQLLGNIFEKNSISAVMHFAGFINVGESVCHPDKYYQNNVAKTITLLNTMIKYQVMNFIFSSSCAVYGDPLEIPLSEKHPLNPVNPYGHTKLMSEQILSDFSRAFGLNYISLRYFNASGADPDGQGGEDHQPETHLIPLILQTALGQRESIHIYGNDYPTRDGTCIRDYIHIDDLAQAHLLAIKRLLHSRGSEVFNLGNGAGYSVKEVIAVARKITGHPIPTQITARRKGDPAVLIGASAKAEKKLGWKPLCTDLDTIIASAWNWHKKHPDGYRS